MEDRYINELDYRPIRRRNKNRNKNKNMTWMIIKETIR
jgi:hypothetical protein